MVGKYPDLERGQSATETGRKHIPPRVFKEMTRLNKQREKLDRVLSGVTIFNAKSKADEISKLLDEYIPNVEKMQTQLKKYKVTFTETVAENKSLHKEKENLEQQLDDAGREELVKKMNDLKLKHDYEIAVNTLNQIPEEVLRLYTQSAQKGKVAEYDR